MALSDRILPLCDLLLGAAHADKHFQDREREKVRAVLAELAGEPPDAELEARIAGFDAKTFDVATAAGVFADVDEADRTRVLNLVAAINDADDEVDFAEDEYLRALAKALALPASALAGLTIEIEELREDFQRVRKMPPPPPPKKTKS